MTTVDELDERGRRLAVQSRMSAEEGDYPAGGIAASPDEDTLTTAASRLDSSVQIGTKNRPLRSSRSTEPTTSVGELPTETEPE